MPGIFHFPSAWNSPWKKCGNSGLDYFCFHLLTMRGVLRLIANMNPFSAIEKLINEHGSAAILGQQLEFARDQFSALERQVADFQSKAAKFEAQLEIERANYNEIKQDFQRLKDEHAEDIRIHNLVEFRRGKRTGQKWMAFCTKCHLPATGGESVTGRNLASCSGCCGWEVFIKLPLELLVEEFGE
jgi:hypothetical protein